MPDGPGSGVHRRAGEGQMTVEATIERELKPGVWPGFERMPSGADLLLAPQATSSSRRALEPDRNIKKPRAAGLSRCAREDSNLHGPSVHKALNRVRPTKMRRPASKSFKLRGSLEGIDGLDRVDVVRVLSQDLTAPSLNGVARCRPKHRQDRRCTENLSLLRGHDRDATRRSRSCVFPNAGRQSGPRPGSTWSR